MDEDLEVKFGWGCFTPKCLRSFRSVNCFLLFVSCFALLQGMSANGFLAISVHHIEREFGFTSKQMGAILAFNDVGAILFVIPVAYYGDKRHKPRWLAIGCLVNGIGSLVFALPKLIKRRYELDATSDFLLIQTCANNNATILNGIACANERPASLSGLYFFIFLFGQFLSGLGATPLYSLGQAHIDDNVTPKQFPIYIGIFQICISLGPSIGSFVASSFLTTYVDIKNPANLSPYHPNFVGAWWLGFVIFAPCLFLTSFMLFGFPPRVPGDKRDKQEAVENTTPRKRISEQYSGIKGLLVGVYGLFRNKTLMCVVAALIIKSVQIGGTSGFMAKYYALRYGAAPAQVGIGFGVVFLTAFIVGTSSGAAVMKCLPVKKHVSRGLVFLAALSLLQIGASVLWFLPGCEDNTLATEVKLSTSYQKCTNECDCDVKLTKAVCGSDGILYTSPCMAGCSNSTGRKQYGNCRCLRGYNSSTSQLFTAKEGACRKACKNDIIFLVLLGVTAYIGITQFTPHSIILMRVVSDDDRSIALAFQLLTMRLLGFIPGQFLFAYVFDVSCIIWKHDVCGNRQSCSQYKTIQAALTLFYMVLAISVLVTLLYALAIFFHQRRQKGDYNLNSGSHDVVIAINTKSIIKDESPFC